MKGQMPIADFAYQWAKHVTESTSPRMRDDQIERAFWRDFIRSKTYAPDISSRQVLDYLRPLLQMFGVETILEIGPGWGNYTLDLAAECREMACVDISQDILDFVLKTGAEHGIYNLQTHCDKWENFTSEKRYDLVFGYNCFYRQHDLLDCFARMTRAANKLCVAGMNSAIVPPWVRELEAAGAQVNWEWKDYIYFVGVLYQMGIAPNVRVLPFQKELRYPDTDALVQGECSRCTPGSVDLETARVILCSSFTQSQDGSWHATLQCRSGVVWWTPSGTYSSVSPYVPYSAP